MHLSKTNNGRTWRRQFVLVALFACTTDIQTNADDVRPVDSSKPVVAPNQEMQSLFGDFVTSNDEAARESLLGRLRQYDRTDRTTLVQQLTLFAMDAQSTRSSMFAGALISEFKMSDDDVIKSLIPMMATDNAKLQKQIKGMLAEYEDQSASRPPDFSKYRAIIANEIREGRAAPVELVLHMYDVDPGAGLLTMMRASQMRDPDELREVLWAEHVVSDSIWQKTHGFIERDAVESQATEQLERIAGHSKWWARLYVPAVMKREPTLKSMGLLEGLSNDPNAFVADAAAKLR
ncbi:MAG: hypothetical protein DHS20C16_03700 [Phycisphaerae bacterium]|nr:MAG: hypothetical protein DHS20C16_03700 [Phycisphaerae bacterium]